MVRTEDTGNSPSPTQLTQSTSPNYGVFYCLYYLYPSEGEEALNKSLSWGSCFQARPAMVMHRREDLHNQLQTMTFKVFAIASAVALSGFAIAVPNANSKYSNHTVYGRNGSSLRYNQIGQFRHYDYDNGRGRRSSTTCSTIGQFTHCN